MARSPDRGRFPLRLNARRFEAFVRGGPTAGVLSLHQKLDGVMLAQARWRRQNASLHLHFQESTHPAIRVRAALADLAPLLTRVFPRARLRVELGLGRRRLSFALGPRRASRGRAHDAATFSPAATRAAVAAVLREIPIAYGRQRGLARIAEARVLTLAGIDQSGRECWLEPNAARRWRVLRRQAADDGVAIELVSGFRSAAYQARIFARKRARGEPLEHILAVNAAPGFSEHHGGFAVDLGAPGLPPVEVSFEDTPAFRWLTANAARLRLRLSFPRDNPHGILYEPWHWRFMP